MTLSIQSGIATAVLVITALLCAWCAKRLIIYGQKKANIRATLFGIDIAVGGGIAAWLASLLIICLVWVKLIHPTFSQRQIWHITGKIMYQPRHDPENFVEATGDVSVILIPPGHKVAGGVFSMDMPADPNAPKHDKFPSLKFTRSDCHKKPVININNHPSVTIREFERTVDLGEVRIDLLPAATSIGGLPGGAPPD